VAVFNAGCIGAKQTRPLLNVTLAKILSFAQFAQFRANFHGGRLHQRGSARKVAPSISFQFFD
jgi:hypothetical protein